MNRPDDFDDKDVWESGSKRDNEWDVTKSELEKRRATSQLEIFVKKLTKRSRFMGVSFFISVITFVFSSVVLVWTTWAWLNKEDIVRVISRNETESLIENKLKHNELADESNILVIFNKALGVTNSGSQTGTNPDTNTILSVHTNLINQLNDVVMNVGGRLTKSELDKSYVKTSLLDVGGRLSQEKLDERYITQAFGNDQYVLKSLISEADPLDPNSVAGRLSQTKLDERYTTKTFADNKYALKSLVSEADPTQPNSVAGRLSQTKLDERYTTKTFADNKYALKSLVSEADPTQPNSVAGRLSDSVLRTTFLAKEDFENHYQLADLNKFKEWGGLVQIEDGQSIYIDFVDGHSISLPKTVLVFNSWSVKTTTKYSIADFHKDTSSGYADRVFVHSIELGGKDLVAVMISESDDINNESNNQRTRNFLAKNNQFYIK